MYLILPCVLPEGEWFQTLDVLEPGSGLLVAPLLVLERLLRMFCPVMQSVLVLIGTAVTWTLQMLLVDGVQPFQLRLLKEYKSQRVGPVVTAQQAFTASPGNHSWFLVKNSVLLFFCPVKELCAR